MFEEFGKIVCVVFHARFFYLFASQCADRFDFRRDHAKDIVIRK
jgi:hypothetical protein